MLLISPWIFNCHNSPIKPYSDIIIPDCYKSGYYKINPNLLSALPLLGADVEDYETVIIGDSVMLINETSPNFIENRSKVQLGAIADSTSCDFQLELFFINSGPNVKYVIIGTMGGNDIRFNVPEAVILKSEFELLTRLRVKFPNAKFVYIQIHPTQIEAINKKAQKLSLSIFPWIGEGCWINPAKLFLDLDPLPASPVFYFPNDDLHYTPYISQGIKNMIINQCKINF